MQVIVQGAPQAQADDEAPAQGLAGRARSAAGSLQEHLKQLRARSAGSARSSVELGLGLGPRSDAPLQSTALLQGLLSAVLAYAFLAAAHVSAALTRTDFLSGSSSCNPFHFHPELSLHAWSSGMRSCRSCQATVRCTAG